MKVELLQTLVSCVNGLPNQLSAEGSLLQSKVATLTLNRPIYVGFTVLELSKLHMYHFHYNHMKVKYPHANQLRLLFTDTGSLAYAAQTDAIYKDMATDAVDRYDLSEYPLDHPLYDVSNCKALGFFKDELDSVPMQEFVGLQPKCYDFLCTGKVDKNVLQRTRPVEKKTAIGVKRKVEDDHLHFAHYLDTLRSFKSYVCNQNLISSSAHTIRTAHTHKIGLTAFDTKRWLCEDTIHTHSHGHLATMSDLESMGLVNKFCIIECITDAGAFSHNDLPGSALQPAEGSYCNGDDQSGSENFADQSDSDSSYFVWDGFS